MVVDAPQGADLIATRPFPARLGPKGSLIYRLVTTTDHKLIGIMYIVSCFIFFFIAGLELKREFVEGSLSRPADALVPIVAAVCGMVFPAGIYTLFNVLASDGHPAGWAIPMATDIAFALAVLAIVGAGLPQAVRAFLLTLAIADDLGSIIVIAVFFSTGLDIWWLAGAIACIGLWGVMQHFHVDNGWWYVPIFIVGWWCMLRSGVHATIAGVAERPRSDSRSDIA